MVQGSGDQTIGTTQGPLVLIPAADCSLPTGAPLRSPTPRQLMRIIRWALIAISVIACAALSGWMWQSSRREAIATLSRQCKKLSVQERWGELATASAKWSGLEPGSADPWLYRAEAAKELKDWNTVVTSLDRVPRTDSRCPNALVQKAAAEFEFLNRPLDGVKTCDELLAIEPRVLIAHKQTIFFCAMTLQRAEMVRRIRQAIRVRRESPESYVYLVGASWLFGGSVYRHNTRWLEGDPDNETYQVARALQVYGTQAKADPAHAAEFEHIPQAEELLKKYPHNLELVAYFLNRSITDGELERVQELLQLIPKDQADGDARFWRARAWCEDTAGNLEQAEMSLRRAFKLDPYWWQIHFQLHDLLRRRGNLEESAKFLEIYKASKDLSTTIMSLNQSIDALDEQKFCRSLLELSELVGDDEVSHVLRERLSPD